MFVGFLVLDPALRCAKRGEDRGTSLEMTHFISSSYEEQTMYRKLLSCALALAALLAPLSDQIPSERKTYLPMVKR